MPLTKLNSASVIERLPVGSVLQTLQTVKTDTFITSATSITDVTGLSVVITPKFSTSKILVRGFINLGASTASFISMLLSRDSTQIFQGDAASNRPRATAMSYQEDNQGVIDTYAPEFLDSPSSTSALTYKVQVRVGSGGGTASVNRSARHSDQTSYDMVTASSITVMEIKG
jgi:hypothetical protein